MRRALAVLVAAGCLLDCSTFGDEESTPTTPSLPVADAGSDATDSSVSRMIGGNVRELARAAQPVSLATDSTSVFFADRVGGSINVVPKTGGPSRPLATGRPSPDYLFAFEQHLYWLEKPNCVAGQAFVQRIRKDGASSEAAFGFFEGGQSCFAISSMSRDVVSLYAVRDRSIVQFAPAPEVPITGGATIVTEQTEIPRVVAADGLAVFWAISNVIRMHTQPSGPTVDFATTTGVVQDIVIDDARVYWIEDSLGIRALARDAKGSAPTVVTPEIGVRRLALEGADLYFTSSTPPKIGRVAKSGGAVETVSEGKAPFALVIDADGLFFTGLDGTVNAIPRK